MFRYGNDDQRTYSDAELREQEKSNEDQPDSHKALDSSTCPYLFHPISHLTHPEDERTIANKLNETSKVSSKEP